MRWHQGLVGAKVFSQSFWNNIHPNGRTIVSLCGGFLRMQGIISDGAMIQATLVDNFVSTDHSWLMMAESPLMCSTRKDPFCGPSSSDGAQCTRGLTWTGKFEAFPKSSKRSSSNSKGNKEGWGSSSSRVWCVPLIRGSMATESWEGFEGVSDSVASASSCWSGHDSTTLGNSSKTPV